MAQDQKTLLRELVAAADRFFDRRLWLRFSDEDIVALTIPGEEQPLFASILGALGEEFGLCLFRGPNAGSFVHGMVIEDRDPDFDECAMLSVTLTPMRDMDDAERRELQAAGSRGAHGPAFIAKDREKQGRRFRRAEMETMLFALQGLVKADLAGWLEPDRGIEDVVPLLELHGKAKNPVSVLRQHRLVGSSQVVKPVVLSPDLAELPRLAARWGVAFSLIPFGMAGDDRSARLLTVLDRETGRVLGGRPVLGLDWQGAADRLAAVIGGDNHLDVMGLPEEIAFTSQSLHEALGPALEALGVRCRTEAIPELAAFLEDLSARSVGEAELEDGEVPAEDDLEAWKRADSELCDVLARRMPEPNRKELKKFFGDPAVPSELGEAIDNAMAAFVEWLVFCNRRGRAARTVAEAMLDDDLPPVQRWLLESRRGAVPSIWRVDRIERGEWLEVTDVLDGRSVRLHDRALSMSVHEDLLVVLRIYPAGAFQFATLAGPALSLTDVDWALETLRRAGIEPEAGGLKDAPHLIGRLWQGHGERIQGRRSMPRLQNTDGDPLLLLSASFSVTDAQALAEALEARADVAAGSEPATWTWLRPDAAPSAGHTVLGQLSLFGTEMLVEVNSRNRLQRLRGWLEEIPGVAFASETERPIDVQGRSQRRDDEPALADASEEPAVPADVANDLLRGHYLAWLDEQVPMFGGRTPREVARTEAGKRRVATMIRTMPRPTGMRGLDLPRREMLREIGMEE